MLFCTRVNIYSITTSLPSKGQLSESVDFNHQKSMVVIFPFVLLAMIMFRTLHKDFIKYNNLQIQNKFEEESGWELILGDVFRVPANSGLLCIFVGTGVQILATTLITMIFALQGFFSPSNRAWCTTSIVVVFTRVFASYSSARLYKMFEGTCLEKEYVAFMFPGILFAILFCLNALIRGEKSSGTVPFDTRIVFVCLWFGTSVSLVFLGSYPGFRKPATQNPVKTNKIRTQIPHQPWYMRRIFMVLAEAFYLWLYLQ